MTGKRLAFPCCAEIDGGRRAAEIEGADDLLVAFPAREGDCRAFDRKELDLSLDQRRMPAPEGQETPVVFEQRIPIALLPVDVGADKVAAELEKWVS